MDRRTAAAHQVGMRSTATMMCRHVETRAEIVEHPDHIRALQDETQGLHRVRAVVPSARQHADGIEGPATSPVRRCTPRARGESRCTRQLRPHPGRRGSARARRRAGSRCTSAPRRLRRHAVRGERHLATGHLNKTTIAEIETLIRESGFTPAQRDTEYRILREAEGLRRSRTSATRRRCSVENMREPAGQSTRTSFSAGFSAAGNPEVALPGRSRERRGGRACHRRVRVSAAAMRGLE